MRESRLFRALQSITLWSSSGSFLKRAASLLAQAGDDGAPPILDEEQIRKLRDLLVRARRAKVVNTIAFWMTLAGAIGLALSTLIEGIGALAMLGLRLVLVIATYWFGKMHIEHKGQQNLYENGARSIVYDLSRSVHEPGGKDSDKRGLVREAIGRGRRWLGDLMQAIAEGRAENHVFDSLPADGQEVRERVIMVLAVLDILRKYVAYRYIFYSSAAFSVVCLATGLLYPVIESGSGWSLISGQWSSYHDVLIFGLAITSAAIAMRYRQRMQAFELLVAENLPFHSLGPEALRKLFASLSGFDKGLDDLSGLPLARDED